MIIHHLKIRNIIRAIVFSISLTVCLLFAMFSLHSGPEQLTMDLKPAIIISFGFSATIELVALSIRHS